MQNIDAIPFRRQQSIGLVFDSLSISLLSNQHNKLINLLHAFYRSERPTPCFENNLINLDFRLIAIDFFFSRHHLFKLRWVNFVTRCTLLKRVTASFERWSTTKTGTRFRVTISGLGEKSIFFQLCIRV